MNEPIAIVGMSCRFPKAPNLDAFWKLLVEGVDAIDEVPPSRYDVNAYYDEVRKTPGKIASREGGFISDVDLFDAEFFGIPPREANVMDPQQRLLLEVAWEALEDAGQIPEQLRGSKTGVFIGMWTNDYEDRMYAASEDVDLYVTTGGGRYAASGRLSYFFDFNGPSITLDTACSSSLVATHLAVQSLRDGESTMALVGGINLLLVPQITIGYSRSGMLSPDGRCKFGDAAADGYVRSEGVGMIVLKPLSRALADNDPIHALIRGSATNNDGRSSELLVAPSPDTQAIMLRDAYRAAGVRPADVQYVEAHGTGTRVGDPVELKALGAVLGEERPVDRPCLVGSVKTNIGHTEAASGIAGLIKAVLCLKHRMIPPNLHFHNPNPAIPWADLPLVIPTELTPLPDTASPAYAGVNSFGVTGTNAHIVLEEAPQRELRQPKRKSEPVLIPLSAKRGDALVARARQLLGYDPAVDLYDVAFTASVRRTHFDQRLAVVAQTWEELRERLTAFVDGDMLRGVAVSPQNRPAAHKIAFVFSGQGGQWLGMGRQLMDQEPVFRAALERCEAALRPLTDWSLLTELTAPEAQSRLDEIDVIQPAIFAIQIALAALWRSWGVEPDAVIGHSMGEVAAACVAGVLSLEEAARVICHRSQLMKRVSGQGAMALVELSFSEAEQVVIASGLADRLGVAVSNGPTSTVLSGDPAALQIVVDQLEDQGVFCRFVKVDVAAHSPHMDALRPLLVDALTGLQPQSGDVPVFSTVAGEQLDGRQFNAEYWGQNLRQPVRFAAAVENALDAGFNTFIEFSPHPVLLSAIERGYSDRTTLITLPSMRRDEDERAALLESLGVLYASGYAVDWTRLYPDGGNLVPLPAYPWQKERFWYSESERRVTRQAALRSDRQKTRPFLGAYFRTHSGSHYWETEIATAVLPYLVDHQVQGRIVFPAAGYVEMALAAAHEVMETGSLQLHHMMLEEALFLSTDKATSVQITLTAESAERATVAIYARQGDTWTRHASGTILATAVADRVLDETPASIQARLGSVAEGKTHYRRMDQRRLGYGPTFQGIAMLSTRDGESVAALSLHDVVRDGSSQYQVHPALLDACFQLLLATLPEDDRATYLPVEVGSLIYHSRPAVSESLYAYARLTGKSADMLVGDVMLLDETGRVLISIDDLRMKRLDQHESSLDDWLYEVRWLPVEPTAMTRPHSPGRWVVFADSLGVGDALASQLESLGEHVVTVFAGDTYQAAANSYIVNPASRSDFEQMAQDMSTDAGSDWRGVVYLWALDEGGDDLPEWSYSAVTGALHLVQMLMTDGLAPRVWLVTCGAQPVTGIVTSPAQSSLWGFGAVLSNEHPELHPVRVDLDPENLNLDELLHELWSDQDEDQVAYRGSQRYAARLTKLPADQAEGEVRIVNSAEQAFRAKVTTPGTLDNLRFQAMRRSPPASGEVEIEVMATGLNFMNVMSALGIYPGYENGVGPLGIECAGRITRVGADVDEWQVGDEVVAVAFNSLATHVITNAQLVARKPEGLTFEEAATIPIVFLTAYYALHHLARLECGERVLIHSGAGGVGQAAIQLARRIGAEVWATAGTPEKRDLLLSMGVRGVTDSRTLAFADDILAATDGEGVDVVLNSLAGEAITRGLEILRPYGRFVEIGKRDIYDNSPVGLLPFSKNLAYFAVDLDRMARERPAVVGGMLREIVTLVDAGEIQPLPLTSFPATQMADAFRYMAQSKHIGKIVIVPQGDKVPVFVQADSGVRDDSSYLITGGLGGLGLTVMRWLAAQGARQIVLTARRDPGESARAEIEAVRAAGVDVQTVRCDVTDAAAVEQLVEDIQQRLLPLRGVFHAAGLLDDAMLLQLDPEHLRNAMRPKVTGAWNLHVATQDVELDWFVLFSSVTAVLGTPGQANYAAGNAFMDGLAHYRRARNLAALSINWGPWSEIGLAAAQANRGDRLAMRGVGSIAPEQGVIALERLLGLGITQASVMPFAVEQWTQTYVAAAQSSLLADLITSDIPLAESDRVESDEDIRALIWAAENRVARIRLLETHVQEHVGYVLGMAAARVDVQKPLRNMGLDSLMTLELRNRLEHSLHLKLPATLAFNYPTVAALAHYLLERLDAERPEERAVETAEIASEPSTDELEGLMQDEIEAMLAEELSSLDDLLKGNVSGVE